MSEKTLILVSATAVSTFLFAMIFLYFNGDVSGIPVHPRANGTMQLMVVPYFQPTSDLWQTIYDQADKYPGTIKYVVINPCSGPCGTPLSQDWQDVISKLRSKGIKTLGYVFNTTESFNNINYYMKNAQVPTDGIFFDNEGSTNALANFKQYSDYVHGLGGVVYINPGYNYSYVGDYLVLDEADVVNMHEVYSNSSDQINSNKEFAPWKISVIIGNITNSQEMKSDVSKLANKGIGVAYLYGDSYGDLPPFFSDEVKEASHTKIRDWR